MALIPEVYGLPLAGKFTAVAWELAKVYMGEQRNIKIRYHLLCNIPVSENTGTYDLGIAAILVFFLTATKKKFTLTCKNNELTRFDLKAVATAKEQLVMSQNQNIELYQKKKNNNISLAVKMKAKGKSARCVKTTDGVKASLSQHALASSRLAGLISVDGGWRSTRSLKLQRS